VARNNNLFSPGRTNGRPDAVQPYPVGRARRGATTSPSPAGGSSSPDQKSKILNRHSSIKSLPPRSPSIAKTFPSASTIVPFGKTANASIVAHYYFGFHMTFVDYLLCEAARR